MRRHTAHDSGHWLLSEYRYRASRHDPAVQTTHRRKAEKAFFIHRGDNKTDLIQMSVQHNVIMAVRISKLSNDVIIMINTHLGVFSKLPRGNVHRLLP